MEGEVCNEEKIGIKFPYGFPSAGNKHQIRLPPRPTKYQPADPLMSEGTANQSTDPGQETGFRYGQTQHGAHVGQELIMAQNASRSYDQRLLTPANFGQQQSPQAPKTFMKHPQRFEPLSATSPMDFGQRMASVRAPPARVGLGQRIASLGPPWITDLTMAPASQSMSQVLTALRPIVPPANQVKCSVCDRSRTMVVCMACGFWHPNLRVRIECPQHGKVHFLGDLILCPRCHTPNLEEENEKSD